MSPPTEAPINLSSIFPLAVVFVAWWFRDVIRPYARFIFHCFLRPLGVGLEDQKSRLASFYKGQAKYYDATRSGLLQGRETMLKLSASHVLALRAAKKTADPLIWVDIGGGTGYNIEIMDKIVPISTFDAVYLIDLCEPLIDVARERFEKKGWKNVHVLCQDATTFTLPSWTNGRLRKDSIGLATMSYSLSMIPDYHRVIDRLDAALSADTGLLSVVDFYTAAQGSTVHQRALGGANKQCSWISRWFWQMWFEFDHIHVGPARRAYLEHKFGTVKNYNDRNAFLIPFLVRIPYYIWIGRPRNCDVTSQINAFNFGSDTPPSILSDEDGSLSLSPAHYTIGKPLRLPFYEQKVHDDFRTYIYSFTWEDPVADMQHLNITPDDTMLVITSAGDNALHYAIHGRPRAIHCVDMNPAQGHLLELKLAAIQSPAVTHEIFWSLFGSGKRANFIDLLDHHLAPYMSSPAYAFWRQRGARSFDKAFYSHGYTGFALGIAQALFAITGRSKDVKNFCAASTIEEQTQIWETRLRPILLNPLILGKLFESGIVCWNALGVPQNQLNMVLNEGTCAEYVRDTFDPLIRNWLLKDDNYFYLLCLLGHYTPDSCPAYLTPQGFDSLRTEGTLDSLKLHTESISCVLDKMAPDSLTKAVIMDHLDWFDHDLENTAVIEEVSLFSSRLKAGGEVYWRTAAKNPWYSAVFERHGFKVSRISVRDHDTAIDRVNMYASFWRATKL
ncbi:hypothetical protein DL96DRAFT_670633 [Flagelloscypha sp. PMI_526]|nr:hypothetical protein DL96DRAFT_670633 [Flagelloscypha sp. PMI_526]